MKILMFFAPAFVCMGKAFMQQMKEAHPGCSFIALATTRQVVERLQADSSLDFDAIECLEEQEEKWLEAPFSEEALKKIESEIGSKNIQNMIVCDRHVGAGFVTCASPIHSQLYQKTRNPEALKSYTLGMVQYADDFLKRHKPDALMAYVVASGPMLAFSLLCEKHGVKFVRLQHTRVENYTVMDTDIKGMLEPLWDRFEAGDVPEAVMLGKAEAWLREYRDDSKDPDYMALLKKQNKYALSLRGIVHGVLKAAARWVLYDFVKGKKPLRAPSGFQGFVQSFTIPFKTLRTIYTASYVSLYQAKVTPYIYFPLHVDPEASTMLLSPDYTNQLTVIEAIAKAMPAHMRLLVKEHPNMNGRRPAGFYQKIANFPGVSLFDPTVTGAQALKHSTLLITITGTAGWEAVLNGKRGIILGDAHFRKFKTALTHCTNLANLSQDIEQALNQESLSDSELYRFMGLLFEESFSLPSSILWGDEKAEPGAEHQKIAAQMVSDFVRRVIDVEDKTDTVLHAQTAA